MSTIANVTLASLALSAKLHSLLDGMGIASTSTEHGLFDQELQHALDKLEDKHPAVEDEAQLQQRALLQRDFEALIKLYDAYKEADKLSHEDIVRFDPVFQKLSQKLKEKKI